MIDEEPPTLEKNEKKVFSEQKNYTTPRSLVMIEYPGLVVNVDKMINTLGGVHNISQVINGEQKVLELHFHPENPFNKPANATFKKNAGVLLSVKIRRSKKDPTRVLKQEVSIVGRVWKCYKFDSLCDFQYLPILSETKENDVPVFINALEKGQPKHVTDVDYFSRTDVPLLCWPLHFARADSIPVAGIYRNDEHEDGLNETLGVLQRTAYDTRDIVKFTMDDPVPQDPDSEIVKKMRIKYVSDEQYNKVRKLFEDCPIWPRCALVYESGISNDKLKCISASLAYYYSTGPWRSMFVRYGYDPRKDFQSRFYQTFDFRLRYRSAMSNWVASRRELLQRTREDGSEPQEDEILQDVKYPYLEEHKLPRTRQCLVRYCDIHIPRIQEMLEKLTAPLNGGVCDARTGWLPPFFDFQVRAIVLSNVKMVLRNHLRKQKVPAELDADSVDNEVMEDAGNEDEASDASNEDNEPIEISDEEDQVLPELDADVENEEIEDVEMEGPDSDSEVMEEFKDIISKQE